ncbi:SulP1 [Desulfamplus magnetovallimortis]|uniref:SulP1 n=1 Tax=Desulfamplus magnetovallimortis TaxID=1246637 RepID=A0A1W1HJE9_9BACT|nr:putative sulfate/molybdate transporter [Desulfamplus magnetovallimortis]SLM32535.1 SulP1 [Desulfamplus magnetovallimortis]
MKTVRFAFNRMEFAGSLGDLGTLLPIAMGMIFINGMEPVGIFFSAGLFYIFSGFYFKVTVPVQPMKVVGAYAIATGMSASQISASAMLLGIVLLVLGGTNAISFVGRLIPKPVIRGVQLSTGVLLMAEGIRFMTGSSKYQLMQNAVEPALSIQSIGGIPIGIFIGFAGAILTLFLLDNKKYPAGIVIIILGGVTGLLFGKSGILGAVIPSFHLPGFLPHGLPSKADFTFVLLALVIPQIPMTIGNAIVAYADLSKEYFNDASDKVTYRASTISMSLANFVAFFIGGMPMCHGAGGLAAHYRFGAVTAGSNIIIGSIFLLSAVIFGQEISSILTLVPMSILGILLVFAGSQLALTILDLTVRKEMFCALIILGITIASNLAAGFMAGIAVAYILKWDKLAI